LFGFDTAVISGAEQSLRGVFVDNYTQLAEILGFGQGISGMVLPWRLH